MVIKIALLAAKGGSSKTTTAVLLAASLHSLGEEAVVLDADPQASALAWAEYATEHGTPLPFSVIPTGMEFPRKTPKDEQFVFLDTPPGDAEMIRAALKWADLAILPTRPGAFDLLQLTPVLNAAEEIGTPAIVLIVQARAGVKETDQIQEALADSHVATFQTQIPLRAATSRLALNNPTAAELKASGYAEVAQEIKEAFSE